MPTVDQAAEMIAYWQRAGKGGCKLPHLELVEESARKRAENPPDDKTGKRKTRIAWDACDADSYAEFHKERERYVQAASGNPTIATDLMICVLRLHENIELKAYAEQVQKATKETGGKF